MEGGGREREKGRVGERKRRREGERRMRGKVGEGSGREGGGRDEVKIRSATFFIKILLREPSFRSHQIS